MSRRSVMSMHADRPNDTALPLPSYFLSVGPALLCLLWAAGWVLPAQPPSHFADPDPARPAIRIHSDMKGPERVVIDTNQPLPTLSAKEIVIARMPVASD